MELARVPPRRRLLTLALSIALVAALLPFTPAPPALAAETFVVNSTGDESVSEIATNEAIAASDVCRGSGTCTLRATIEQSNQTDGADIINFGIAAEGQVTILVPDPGLPAITDPVTIDGTTQPGYENSPLIELAWVGTETAGLGLQVSTENTLIKGLAITGFDNGVQFDASGGLEQNQIRDSFIGTADGVTAKPNIRGIRVFSSGTLIGPNNVISGNTNEGIQITGSSARAQVFTNLIGATASGESPLGNNAGITLENGTFGNLINANTVAANRIGIVVQAPGNRIVDNLIGGPNGLGNVSHGIQIVTDDTTVGVQADGAGIPNEIIGNGANGIQVLSGVRNRISQNTLRDNDSIAIDLGNDGVTPNDEDDGDTGPNQGLNFPELSPEGDGVMASVDGPPGLADTHVTVELYQVASCDPSGHGEADTYITTQAAAADTGGDVTVTFAGLPLGTYTGLAIDSDGNTSELSACLPLVVAEEPSTFTTLYGVESGTDSLSVIDPSTGDVTLVGKLGGAGEYETPVAMAVDPSNGSLFAWNNSDPPQHSLATVDRCTGAATLIGSGGEQLSALAFAPDGTLYGLDDALFEVDPATGVVTPIGHFDGPVIAAADFGHDGVLYGVELTGLDISEQLYTIDLEFGSLNPVGTLSTEIGVIGSIVFGPDGTLVGSGSDGPDGPEGDILFDIDPSTAVVSNVRSLDGWAPQGMGFSEPCEAPAAAVGFALDSSSGLEGTTQFVDVVLSIAEGTLSEPVTVTVEDASTGTATAGEDYTLDTTEIVFPAGSSDGDIQQVQLTLATDSVIETTETVDLQIADVSGSAALDPERSTHQASIVDASLGEGISLNAVSPPPPGSEFGGDGPPSFTALGLVPFSELDPLAAVRAGTGDAEEELASVGSGIAAIGSGIAAIGSGIAAIGSGIAAIGSGIAAIGSGIAAIGSGIAAIDISVIGSGIAAIGSGIAAIDPPLSTIPITAEGDSWEERLAGTVFDGAALQSITLTQVVADAPEALDHSTLGPLVLGGIDYSGSAFGSLSLASITVGNLTLGEIGSQTEDTSFSCSSSGADACSSTVFEADVAGADMRAIGSGIAAIQIADVDLGLQPIGSTTIGAIGSGIAAIDLIFDCNLVDCSATSTDTLAFAQDQGAIKLTFLGELYLLLLPASSFDWTQMPVDLLQVDVGPLARYDLTFVHQGAATDETLVEVTLPVGVHHEPGTATLRVTDSFGNLLSFSTLPEPEVIGQSIRWTFSTVPGVRYEVSFGGRINVMPLGVHRASAVVTAQETELSVLDKAPITITENFELNNDPVSATTIGDTGLYVSYLPDGSDEDYFTFGIPEGKLAKVLLSHLDDDFDLIYYEPTSVSESSSRDVSEFGPTTPPLDDEGRHTGTDTLDPEAANDLDLEAIGSGIAAIGSGIAAIGSNRGTEDETVEGASDGTVEGEAGIRVAGYNGASSDEPYLLQLRIVQPFDVVCDPLVLDLSGITPGELPSSAPSNVDTLILWNAQRTAALHGADARSDMETAIASLVEELQDQGHVPFVIPLDGSETVRTAYTAWDLNPCSASGANEVVRAINDLVDSYDLAPPQLTSITLIGGDVLVPYERRIDLTDIANEREYGPALKNVGSGPQAGEFGALSGGWVLSNDAYAAFTSVYDWLGHNLYLPDVAIGRVVETPTEIVAQIGQYVAAQGILNPNTAVTDLDALVTGYDFLIDGANAQADGLDAHYGTGATDRSLNDDFWDAVDLEAALLRIDSTTEPATADPDRVIGLGAHFDHQRLFPADIGAVGAQPAAGIAYSTSDLLGNTFAASLAGRVIFSVGCHSGLTVPAGITLPGGGSNTDWAQAFSSVGAVFVGNTGFGYGLDGAVGLSEKLMEGFTVRLDGKFFIGDALASAKQEHFSNQLVYGPYDEKVMAESTLFGFPFWRLTGDTPTGETPPGPPPSGTQTRTFEHTLVDTGSGDYYTVDGQSTQLFHRPIQPQDVSQFLTTDATRATGVIIRGLTSQDVTPFDPVFARPVFDLAAREPELETPGTIFPNVFASTSSRQIADGIVSTVALAAGQFIGEGDGVQRLFTEMNVEMLFGAVAGSAPEIVLADAELSNPSVSFRVEVTGSADEVLVLYKEAGFDVGEVVWSTLSLTETSAGAWTGTVDGVSEQIEWFAQVRSGPFVSTSFNKGALFAARLVDAGDDASVVEGDTRTQNGSFIDPVGSGPYTATIDWGDGTSSEVTSFPDIPDSTALGITAEHVYADDGVYPVEVCVNPLGEGTECDTATVTVVNADPFFDSVDLSAAGSVVSLTAGFDDPGADDTHVANVDWGDDTLSSPVVDPSNRTVVASHDFGLTDPATGTITVTLTDDDGGTTIVEIVNGNVAPVVGPVTGPTDPVAVDTVVTISADFADFDATGGYTATIDWGDSSTTAGAVTFDGATRTGIASGGHTYTAAGVYTVTVTVTDGGEASGSDVFEFVVVYDPDAGFVTGGGWIASPAGAYHPDPTLTGKANFGFVSRYQKGKTVPSGDTEFQFRAASFNFKSMSYEWLVIAGARAQFLGEGTINGIGAPPEADHDFYKFFLVGFDGHLNSEDAHEKDKFRIKIWYEVDGREVIVYDNQPGEDVDSDASTELGGGSVVIHSGR